MKTKTTKLTLEQLEDRMVPSAASIFGPNADVSYHGGELLTHPQVTNVYVGSVPNMDAFTNVLVAPYGNALASAYGVGSGTLVQSINSATTPNSDYAIRQMLKTDFSSGVLPAPIPGASLYMVYLPFAPSGSGGGTAYHGSLYYNGQQVAYAVSWSRLGNVQTLAWDASHEYTESATDPYALGTGGSGWYGANDYNYEVCDITNNFAWFDGYKMAQFVTPPGFSPPPSPAPSPTPTTPPSFSPPTPSPAQEATVASSVAGLDNFYEVVLQDFETLIRTILSTVESDLVLCHTCNLG